MKRHSKQADQERRRSAVLREESNGAENTLNNPETFISQVDTPLEPEVRLAKIEVILKLFGLPNLDEFSRQELEAEGRKNRRRKTGGTN